MVHLSEDDHEAGRNLFISGTQERKSMARTIDSGAILLERLVPN